MRMVHLPSASVRASLLAALCAASLAASMLDPADSRAAPGPERLAERIAAAHSGVLAAVEDWRAEAGDPPAKQAPPEVIEPARELQELVRDLAARPKVVKPTLALLPGPVRPEPLAELDAHYREAERRYGIGAHYLAAINLVETKFGRVKSKSTAGARGPMQFIPSSWKIYGEGGDIGDPRDAILAAARLLRANGAPRSYPRALYAYNPSRLYVAAVRAYARLIARSGHAVHYLYAWGP